MKGRTLGFPIALILFVATALAGVPTGGSPRATVTVTAYVLPKSTCTLGSPSPAAAGRPAVWCETPAAQPNPVVRVERVESERPGVPKAVLTVLP
ncbi:hypothetical protein HRbin11_01148 [bacterium HR11]|nr:hypothetical protein HRbin11_01148 [bacterium HR11]